MEAKDGSAGLRLRRHYTDVVEHERIAYTLGDRAAEVVFRPTPAGTAVRVTFDAEDTHTIEQQRQGWQAILDNFRRHVESERPLSATPPLRGAGPQSADRSPGDHHPRRTTMPKNTICLWYDTDAEAAARFYAATFPDSAVHAVHRAPADYPSGKKGDVLTVEFTVLGIPCLGLNGGPAFKHTEAFSFQIATDDQAETDRYWDAIVGNGGEESACGWCRDRWACRGRSRRAC
jgi:predicted 3-demethylubiquinone-9 3-methyltransferase (glyoxalase superfamily)